jgi:hypothetical protein
MLIDKRIIKDIEWLEDESGWYWIATEIDNNGKQIGRTGNYYELYLDPKDMATYRLSKEDQEEDIKLLFEIRP